MRGAQTNTVFLAKKEKINNIPIRNKEISVKDCKVFFDFDNTITAFDVLDDIIKKFSINKSWISFENAWKTGKIGSRECLYGQLKSIRASKKEFTDYLSGVTLDPAFSKLLNFLRENKVSVAILSDSFSFAIKYILQKHGISGIRVYANGLRINKDRWSASFPYFNKSCQKCANCKKNHVFSANPSEKVSIYIGDGLSDICAAQYADLVFAKANLLQYLRAKSKPCVEFKSLETVHNVLKEAINERSAIRI